MKAGGNSTSPFCVSRCLIIVITGVLGYGTEFGRCFTSFGFNLPSRLRPDLMELDSVICKKNSFHSDVIDEPGSDIADILSGFGQMVACSLLRLHKQKRETSMRQSEGLTSIVSQYASSRFGTTALGRFWDMFSATRARESDSANAAKNKQCS